MGGRSQFAPDPILTPIEEPVVDAEGIVRRPWHAFYRTNLDVQETLQTQGYVLFGTHADRLLIDPNTLPSGTLYVESDRPSLIYIGGSFWSYLTGIMQTSRAGAPNDLGTHDIGLRLRVLDFGHIVRWTGAAWTFEAGELESQIICDFTTAPTTPFWAICDGVTPTTVLGVGTATLTAPTVTPPNAAGTVLAHKYLRR